jgi:Na+/melibiose symporter-like transporter
LNHQKNLIQAGKTPLLDARVLKIPQLRSGLGVLMSQYLIVGAVFFVLPIYLQMVIGLNALETGLRILPLSVSLILFSMFGSKTSQYLSPKKIVKIGQLMLITGVIIITTTIDPELTGAPLFIGMFLLGAGLGLLASQLGNINMNAVDKRHSSEVGGMQGTAQNIGSSLGTAIIGSVLIMTLSSGFSAKVTADSQIPDNVKQAVAEQANKGIPVLSTAEVEKAVQGRGYTAEQTQNIVNLYTESQLAGLKQAMVLLIFLSILSLFMSSNLPDTKVQKVSDLKLQEQG